MKRNCPKKTCHSDQIIKDGSFYRSNDSRKIQRFKCKTCGARFSASTGSLEFMQKKRRVNFLLLKLFCAKVTQKRAARIAGVNKTTVQGNLITGQGKRNLKMKALEKGSLRVRFIICSLMISSQKRLRSLNHCL